jgi:hypothetical protein
MFQLVSTKFQKAAPRIIRVFPRKTRATPTDALAYFGPPDRVAEADAVHVSVTFTFDKAWAEHLAEQWRHAAPSDLAMIAGEVTGRGGHGSTEDKGGRSRKSHSCRGHDGDHRRQGERSGGA